MVPEIAQTVQFLHCKFWQCTNCTDNAQIRSIAKILECLYCSGKDISLDV